jgi:uncharacterized peroxidase-related enzyme
MPNIAPIDRKNPAAEVALQLDTVRAKLGVVPNLVATLAHSPVALNAYLGLSEATGKGELSAQDRERIALAVGQTNSCDYCLAAHSLVGRKVGLSDDEIIAARNGRSVDARSAAILRLARAIVDGRGRVDAAELAVARDAGLGDRAILEVLANVVANIFTNYAGHLADTEMDFPKARALAA